MDADTHKGTRRSRTDHSPRRGWRRRGLARLRSQLGAIALPEVLVAAPLMVATLGAVLSLNLVSVNELDRVESRVHVGASKEQPVNQRVALARMTRDVRQAKTFITASGMDIEFNAMLKPADGGAARERRVFYRCYVDNPNPDFDGKCKRWEGPSGGGSWESSVFVLENVVNADVFAIDPPTKPDPNDANAPWVFNDLPTYATVKLAVAVKHDLCPEEQGTGCRNPNPADPIVLETGAALLNTKPNGAG